MSEEELRQEAVRRRLAGESPTEIAEALDRTTRWVRKWVARHDGNSGGGWSQDRSRAPHHSPTKVEDQTRDLIVAARQRLVANPRAQYGALAIQWELRRIGVAEIPASWTIERVLTRAGLTRPRRRRAGYVSKHVPYPRPVDVEPGTTHQIDMIGPLFRTEVFNDIAHLQAENDAFIDFHNTHHRYSAHGGASPGQIWDGRTRNLLNDDYRPPTQLPARGRIEVVRFIRSNRRVDLFGKRITVAEDQTHQYVTAIIKVRAKKVIVVTIDGEVIHNGSYDLSRTLR